MRRYECSSCLRRRFFVVGGCRGLFPVLAAFLVLDLLALDLVDHLTWPCLHLALEVRGAGLRTTLPDGAAHLALDALDRRFLDVMLLDEPALDFLRDEARALPFDPVDRAAGDEPGGEDEEQAGVAKHPESLPERQRRALRRRPAAPRFRIDASTISIGCSAGIGLFTRRSAVATWTRQPGLALA